MTVQHLFPTFIFIFCLLRCSRPFLFGHQRSLYYYHHDQPERSLSSLCSSRSSFISNDDLTILKKGGIFVHHDWISKEEIQHLRKDIQNLRNQGYFRRSGLSNRVDGDQNSFGLKDRLTCTISEHLKIKNRIGNEDKDDAESCRIDIENRLDEFKLSLMKHLNISALEFAEHYYSISPPGSALPRHMDERHEETKGDKAWESESRRSISWLLYLNDGNFDKNNNTSGGELRAFCRLSSTSICGSHEGNLQVGWILSSTSASCSNDSKKTNAASKDTHFDDTPKVYDPVFLDSWIKTPASSNDRNCDNDGEEYRYGDLDWKPLSALYRVCSDPENDTCNKNENYKREYITEPFGPDTPLWPSNINLEPKQFIDALGQQVSLFLGRENDRTDGKDSSTRPSPLIDVQSISDDVTTIVDIVPSGGTLVLFDSVTMPHEVLQVTERATKYSADDKGGPSPERYAMAGWFHEPLQEFPDWYGT